MFLCALVGPLFPPAPAPCLLYASFLCVRLFCCFLFFVFALSAAPARPACAPCSSPCYLCPAALRPLTRLSPLPFAVSLSTLPVRLPSLSEPRCHSCVPPACSTPAPPRRPYPFPCGLPHLSAPSIPVSHPILVALCPVCVGGVYLRTGLWPCPRTGMAVGFLRTMSHRMCRRNTERASGRRLSNSFRCICTVEPSRIDQLWTRAPNSGPAQSPRVHISLHLAGVRWRRRPPRPGVVNPSEQGARKSNGFNAAPSCHAESFAAM